MTRKKSNILLTAVIFLSLHSRGQFHYTALLDTVKATGFYNVLITPKLSSYLKTDLSDLRIVDEKKQAIPFIIEIPARRKIIDAVVYDKKIIKKQDDEEKTVLVIENEGKQELSDLVIELKSAAAERTASLSGSDDNAHWFVVLDSLVLHKSDENSEASHSQRIKFPRGNYKYFRLTIHNGKKEPLNILSAGSSGTDPYGTPEFVFVNPSPSFSQTDSGRYTLIKIIGDKPYHVSMIKFNISRQWFYKRQAKLFTEIRPGLEETWNSTDHSVISLTSDNFSDHPIRPLKSRIFYLLIENGDNPPLKIDSISTGQVKRRVIAQLEKGISYSLLLDNPQATTPDYDLQHFRDRIPDNSIINIKKIIALPQPETIEATKQVNKWWIWPVIILVILLLAILAWKLATDMKKINNNKTEGT